MKAISRRKPGRVPGRRAEDAHPRTAASPRRRLRRVAAYAWAAPCTTIGLALGAAAWTAGARWRRHDGVVEVALARSGGGIARGIGRLPFAAITFGHVILGRDADALDQLRPHERAHVAQYERWGPMLLLAYPLASLALFARGRRPYADNPFEVGARARESGDDASR